tara:strand:- start:353 stop:961 length:609 start_codon:yes stop_codon:yes gene_type:complete
MSDSESLSDDPIDEIDEPIEKVKKTRKPSIKVKKSKKVEMILPEDAEIGSDSEEETVKLKTRRVVKVAPAVRKKREWSDEQRADFALRMKKARDAKLKVKKEVVIPQEEPEIAELIKEGKKARKAKLKASIKKEAIKILKQEQAENIVSDSDTSESEPEMKAVKQYITRRKARKKTKQVKAPPKPKENVVVNEEQSLGYQFL